MKSLAGVSVQSLNDKQYNVRKNDKVNENKIKEVEGERDENEAKEKIDKNEDNEVEEVNEEKEVEEMKAENELNERKERVNSLYQFPFINKYIMDNNGDYHKLNSTVQSTFSKINDLNKKEELDKQSVIEIFNDFASIFLALNERIRILEEKVEALELFIKCFKERKAIKICLQKIIKKYYALGFIQLDEKRNVYDCYKNWFGLHS